MHLARGCLSLICSCAVLAAHEARSASGEVLGFNDIAGHGRFEVPGDVPCSVTGVVTYVASWIENSGIIADADNPNGCGIWFSGEVNARVVAKVEGSEALECGQVVEILGTSSRLGFAPGIKAQNIKVLETGRHLPSPPEYRLRDFDWGVLDNRRAAIRGVLMEVSSNSVPGIAYCRFATVDGEFTAHIPCEVASLREKIDAGFLVSGVAMSIFNIRGEFIGVQMKVLKPEDAVVTEEAMGVDALEEVSLVNILPYMGRPPSMHRRRLRGTVTLATDDGCVYLQNGDGALRVRTAASDTLKPGDEVIAIGFPRIESGIGLLASAEVRKIRAGRKCKPLEIFERDLSGYPVNPDGGYVNLDARLVTFEGSLLAANSKDVSIAVGETRIFVTLAEPIDQEISMAAGEFSPKVRMTGILSIIQNPGSLVDGVPSLEGWRLDAAPHDGIKIVENNEWRAYRRRVFVRKAVRFGVLICALAVVYFTIRYLGFKSNYRRLDILAKERKRMAADLHDTIEQNLLSAKLLMQTAISMEPGTPQTVKEAIDSAGEILISAKREIRETIFNLRNDEIFSRRPEDVIKTVAKQISALGVVNVRTSLRGLPKTLPGAMFSDVIHIIKEASTNAVKHGMAKNVIIASDPADGGCLLRIVNDGKPFDPILSPGPEAGHFGLVGMRERAIRNGIGFSIGIEKGMTTIRLEVKQ